MAEDALYPVAGNICTKLEQKSLVIDGLGKPDLRSGRSPLDAKSDRDQSPIVAASLRPYRGVSKRTGHFSIVIGQSCEEGRNNLPARSSNVTKRWCESIFNVLVRNLTLMLAVRYVFSIYAR